MRVIIAFLIAPAAVAESVVIVEFQPAAELQIAVWIEDADGEFVDTLMVTRAVGTFGLGNRPGRADLSSGYLWPYGRREMALPVWAHRRGIEYDRLVFQNCKEGDLGYHAASSSLEPFYCRPTTPAEMSVDTITCPTAFFNSDKGIPLRLVSPTDAECAELLASQPETSLYPPRNDVFLRDPQTDWSDVLTIGDKNDLDAISRATPPAQETVRLSWMVPPGLPNGEYVVFVEAAREFDANEFHDYSPWVDPVLPDYGIHSIGQPSVVWEAAFAIGDAASEALTVDYTGYGSPDGSDGDLRPPDGTITTDLKGSGADRLAKVANDGAPWRVRVTYEPDTPCKVPAAPTGLRVVGTAFDRIDLEVDAPVGAETIEVRFVEGPDAIVSDLDFLQANPAATTQVEKTGSVPITILPLRPQTAYTFSVRALDACGLPSVSTAINAKTEERIFTTVDACFVATAAWGTSMATEIGLLRRFRDRLLARYALGRAAISLYGVVGPPLAKIIAPHPPLRALARELLRPMVALSRLVP